jgi:hypothetical protein
VPGIDERRLTQLARLVTDLTVLADPGPPPHLARRKGLTGKPDPRPRPKKPA